MTPTEARALADRAEKYGHSPIGLRKPPQAYALLDSAKALRSLADQVEALQKALDDFCEYAEACGDDSPEFERAKKLRAREAT